MLTSRNILLRLTQCTPEESVPSPRVLGLEDRAKRKRQTCRTILVDFERHCPIDLARL